MEIDGLQSASAELPVAVAGSTVIMPPVGKGQANSKALNQKQQYARITSIQVIPFIIIFTSS